MGEAHRGRCHCCFRPLCHCYCAAIPYIRNQTEVLILQHRREHFHPFNTARMVHRALCNSSLLVDHTPGLAARLALRPHAGLLYPGAGSELLANLPHDQRPKQLVVIDGTWHHAKTIVRDISALHDLPRYGITPIEPSRYCIRREPNDMLLSTVEATVAALRVLEPETCGLERLLDTFGGMVERQLAHPKNENGWRRNARRSRDSVNVPSALLGNLDRVVVAYGECVAEDRSSKRAAQAPVFWTAQRLGCGELFTSAIQPPYYLESSILRHLELTEEHFTHAISLNEMRAQWNQFLRPGDILVVYNQSTAKLLARISNRNIRCLVLKSIDFNPQQRYSTLDDLIAGEGLTVAPAQHPGRAGKRLASVVAFIRHLRALKLCAAS